LEQLGRRYFTHDFIEPWIIWPNEIRDLIRICRLHKILLLKTIDFYAQQMEKAPELLAEPPKIEKADVLADRLPG